MLELLAGSGQPLTTSTIARELGLNLSTCTAILRSLVAAGWVRRDDDRRHRLGSGLFPILDAVRREFPLLRSGQDELEALHADVGHGVTLTRLEPHGLVVAGTAGPLPEGVSVGHRFPLTPPYGLVARAWAPRAEFDEWLDGSPLPLDRQQRIVLRRAAKEIRDRGWVAWRMQPATTAAIDALRTALASTGGEAAHRELLRLGALFSRSAVTPQEVAGRKRLPVAYLLAPVGSGLPKYQLELHLFEPAMQPADVRAVGERLRQTADRLAA